MEKIIKCPCCLSQNTSSIASLESNEKIKLYKNYSNTYYNGILNTIDKKIIILEKCLNCQHIFYKYQPSDDFLTKMYEIKETLKKNLEKKTEISKKKTRKLNELIKKVTSINNGKKLLDFGAGSGSLQNICQNFNIDYFGYEPVESRSKKIDNIRNFSNFEILKNKNINFDFIVLNQVLEHMKNPLVAMTEIYSLCNDKTLVYVSVPNLNRSKEKEKLLQSWPYDKKFGHHTLAPFQHLHGFNTKSLILLMNNAGFEVSKSPRTILNMNIKFFRIFFGLFLKKISTTDILFKKKFKF